MWTYPHLFFLFSMGGGEGRLGAWVHVHYVYILRPQEHMDTVHRICRPVGQTRQNRGHCGLGTHGARPYTIDTVTQT